MALIAQLRRNEHAQGGDDLAHLISRLFVRAADRFSRLPDCLAFAGYEA
jgi:hypothetical protein